MYVNSSLAKVEALKAGYDEAILLAPDGNVSECTGENIFIVRGGRSDHPADLRLGRARGHHPEVGRDDRPRPRATRSSTSSSSAPTSTPPTRPSSPAPPPRWSRSGRSTTARWATGKPGPDHPADPADLLRHRARRGGPVQGLAGLCRVTAPPSPTTIGQAGGGPTRPTGTRTATARPGALPPAHGRPGGPRPTPPLTTTGTGDADDGSPGGVGPRLRPARPARGGRRLRHHPARRVAAGGPVADRRRQAAGGRAARPSRA